MSDDVAKALARVALDPEPDPDLVRWAAQELLAGGDLSTILSDLIEHGWPAEAAEAAVEQARVATRGERGIVTRAEVVRAVSARHRRSRAGLIGIFGFVAGLWAALRAVRRPQRRDTSHPTPRGPG